MNICLCKRAYGVHVCAEHMHAYGVYVCVRVCACVYVCVCARERARECLCLYAAEFGPLTRKLYSSFPIHSTISLFLSVMFAAIFNGQYNKAVLH